MKTILLTVSLLLFAVSAMALPFTDAAGTPEAETVNRVQRNNTGSRLLAQTRPEKGTSNDRAASTNRTAGKQAAKKQSSKKDPQGKAKRVLSPITSEMEAAVDKFVREHHRELVEVLAHLKENVPKEYERAVRDLNRNQLRLKQLEGRDRYAGELGLWKAQSRARLLGARVQMGDDALRDELRKTLAQIYDLRADLLQRDRERTLERLKKLDEQLESLRKGRDENLDKQLTALTKVAPQRTKSVKTNSRSPKPSQKQSKKDPVRQRP